MSTHHNPTDRELIEELMAALEACEQRLLFIHGHLVPHNYDDAVKLELHEDVPNIEWCLKEADRALTQANERDLKRAAKAKRVIFQLNKVFPSDDPLSIPLLRLMLAADDARHLQMLLLMADDQGHDFTKFDRLITNGTTLHLFRLLCGHLYEAGIAFRAIEQSHPQVLDEAVTGDQKLEGNLTNIRQAYAQDPEGAFHYSFLKPMRTHFGFHYKDEPLREALRKHNEAKDLEGTMIVAEYLGLGRYTVCDHLVTSAIQDLLGAEWSEFQEKFDEVMGKAIELAGILGQIVNQLLLHLFKQREEAIISEEGGTVTNPLWGQSPQRKEA